MSKIDYDVELKKAELTRIQAETARTNSEREKVEEENRNIVFERSKNWWDIRAKGLIQAVIAGVAAGALLAGFGLDHFLKVSDLNEKSQLALKMEKQEVENEKRLLEEKSRQSITSLQSENLKLKAEVDNVLKKISLLSSTSNENNDKLLNVEISELKLELEKARTETESRGKQLSSDLIDLTQAHAVTAKDEEGSWFPIIASAYNKLDLTGKLKELNRISLKYPLHVYSTADKRGVSVYAITLGGYLTKSESLLRVRYAKSEDIAKDAYAWSSNLWEKNIISSFE
jgi:hypothetical protein